MSFRFLLSLLAILPGFAAAQDCGVVTVGKSGTGAECSTPSLKEAVRLATDSAECYLNEIWITSDVDNRLFDGGTLEISGKTVKIVGGFTSSSGGGCRNLTRTSRSVISGRSGSTDSVITIRGNSTVALEHLVISDGDDGSQDEGGGIDFKGSGLLTLANVTIERNKAGYGGGLLVAGEGVGATVSLRGNVIIRDNVAYQNGGGVHLRGDTRFFVTQSAGNGFVANTARGDGGTQGYGGGLYLRHPARATLRGSDRALFERNSARHGGAIAVRPLPTDGGAETLLAAAANGPLIIIGNTASVSGGAIYLGTDYEGGQVASASICLYDTQLRDNESPRGAAIFADTGTNTIGDEQTQGNAYVNYCPDHFGLPSPTRCPASMGCSTFIGNRAVNANGSRTDGDIVEFPGSDGDFVAINTRFVDNYGGSVIRMGDSDFGRLDLANVVFGANTLGETVIDSDASASLIRHATIADNVLSGSHVLRLIESGDADLADRVDLTNTIIDQPGKTTLDHGGSRSQSVITYVMATEVDSLATGATGRDPTHVLTDTDLVSAGFYVLGNDSRAIDFASPLRSTGEFDQYAIDLFGNARSIDLPTRGTVGSPNVRDLGAIERTSVTDMPPPDRPDPVFKNGFE